MILFHNLHLEMQRLISQQAVLDKGSSVLLIVRLTELGNADTCLFNHGSWHREHNPEISRIFKAAPGQTEDTLLVYQFLDEMVIVLKIGKAFGTHSNHHVHGSVRHYRIKSAYLFQYLICQLSIGLPKRMTNGK